MTIAIALNKKPDPEVYRDSQVSEWTLEVPMTLCSRTVSLFTQDVAMGGPFDLRKGE